MSFINQASFTHHEHSSEYFDESYNFVQRFRDHAATVVCGAEWWDEWKGKIVDVLIQEADIVVRFNGWHNAGHSVHANGKEYALHILPSGMVSNGKINLISSWCVVATDARKIKSGSFEQKEEWSKKIVCNKTLGELFDRDKESNEIKTAGLMPELEKLRQWGIDLSAAGLKISGEATAITMLDVLMDAFAESNRKAHGLELIWSTGSGISRAYAGEIERQHSSISDLLYRPDLFFNSLEEVWNRGPSEIFEQISFDEIVNWAKKEKEILEKYINEWVIQIIDDEKSFIQDGIDKGLKVIGEWAQSSLIGSKNSIFGTASHPSIAAFSEATGIYGEQIGNVFIVKKYPSSSVGTRPQFLAYPPSKELDDFRNKFGEYGVSSWRLRDLFVQSLPETARWVELILSWIDESKIVPIYNRMDAFEEAKALYGGKVPLVTWYSYQASDFKRQVWLQTSDTISRKSLLRWYPQKSEQAWIMWINVDLDIHEIQWNTVAQMEQLLAYQNAAIFNTDGPKEFLIGTGPGRWDLAYMKWVVMRELR